MTAASTPQPSLGTSRLVSLALGATAALMAALVFMVGGSPSWWWLVWGGGCLADGLGAFAPATVWVWDRAKAWVNTP